MKLININSDHYIVVDETIQPVSGWYYDKFIEKIRNTNGAEYSSFVKNQTSYLTLQITHSTQPLGLPVGKVAMVSSIKELVEKGYDSILPLNIDEIKELTGEVDKAVYHNMTLEQMSHSGHYDFVKGYNQAIEDNKEKVYTEKQVIDAVLFGVKKGLDVGNVDETDNDWVRNYVKSIKPKSEWEVEFVDGKLTKHN